jgi:nicotinate-nucleotide pyrophosphorylase (carboxylating)
VELTSAEIRRAVRAALAEDLGGGDATTLATVPQNARSVALLRAREPLVVAGIGFAETAFREVAAKYFRRDEFHESPTSGILKSIDSEAISARAFHESPTSGILKSGTRGTRPSDGKIKIEIIAQDGQYVAAGKTLLKISGPARAILSAERVALNFVQRLSGIATLTAQFVEAVRGTSAQILDTRKTTPGWRRFEKYAVACGGGKNHRIGLFDMILIKDNHLAALKHEKPNAIAAAIQRARKKFPKLKIEVEADTLEQAAQAADAGADIILLDNMDLKQLRSAVKIIAGRAKTEASGGVNLKTVRAIAETGVDFISVGALTHSARAVDIGLDFEG